MVILWTGIWIEIFERETCEETYGEICVVTSVVKVFDYFVMVMD